MSVDHGLLRCAVTATPRKTRQGIERFETILPLIESTLMSAITSTLCYSVPQGPCWWRETIHVSRDTQETWDRETIAEKTRDSNRI